MTLDKAGNPRRRALDLSPRKSRRCVFLAATFLMCAALVGCSPSGANPELSPTPEQPAVPAPWVPAHLIAPVTMSDADMMSLRDKQLASLAQAANLTDPPVVALVRWTSHDDWGSTIAQCERDAGFNAVGSGSVLLYPDGIGAAQRSAFDLADYVCNAKYTMNPKYNVTFTADQWGIWYDYNVEWEVPCLATLGVTVSQPPTRETYIAQGLQTGQPAWSPWSEADFVFAGSWQKDLLMTQTCPDYPPAQYLWG